jgi:hypothetical protein
MRLHRQHKWDTKAPGCHHHMFAGAVRGARAAASILGISWSGIDNFGDIRDPSFYLWMDARPLLSIVAFVKSI